MAKRLQKASRAQRMAARIDSMPRFWRVMLNMLISLIVMAVVGLPIAYIFSRNINELEGGQFLYIPTILIAVIWLAVYSFGWQALVGFDWNEDEPWKAGRPAVVMIVIGMSATFFLLLEIVFGLLFAFVL
jgi:hypothetical protein